jgi:carbonyl reductase 1
MIAAFRAAINSRSIASVTDLMDAFAEAVAYEEAHAGDEGAKVEKEGWPRSAYAVSKAGLTAVSMILGQEELRNAARKPTRRGGAEQDANLPVLINACCPGFVNTDMTNNRGRKMPDRGAETPVMLALEDLKCVGGEFWERRRVSVWDAADDVKN